MFLSPITNWLFMPPPPERRWYNVIGWWEARRPAYNAILLAGGILSTIGMIVFLALPPTGFVRDPNNSPNDLGDPLVAVMILALFAIGANLCYTLGRLAELPIYWSNKDRPNVAPALFKTGLIFSLIVIAVPTVVSFFYWLYRIVS